MSKISWPKLVRHFQATFKPAGTRSAAGKYGPRRARSFICQRSRDRRQSRRYRRLSKRTAESLRVEVADDDAAEGDGVRRLEARAAFFAHALGRRFGDEDVLGAGDVLAQLEGHVDLVAVEIVGELEDL